MDGKNYEKSLAKKILDFFCWQPVAFAEIGVSISPEKRVAISVLPSIAQKLNG